MNFKVHLHESLLNLFSAKLRSILAILGVLVGTSAVVALMASSRLATDHALAQFKSLGTNLLSMDIQDNSAQSETKSKSQNLTLNKMPKILQASSGIIALAPYINFYKTTVLYGKQVGGEVLATTDTMQSIAKIHLTKGRFVSYLDHNAFYCVIGSDIAKQFQKHYIDPIGKQIKVGNALFIVVGVAAPWRRNLFLLVDVNKAVIIPLNTAYLIKSPVLIRNILFRLVKNPNLPVIQQKITNVLGQLLPNKKLRFRNPEQIIELVGKERRTFSGLLIAIGSIALVVGGIGVMNIMLVSVIERRREIGIRLAIGAKRWNILMMFLIESVLLTVFGGLIGILLGLSVTYVLAYAAGWEFHFYLMPPLLGFIVSVLVGILSGFYPAWRASKLDPIACLTR